MKTYSPKPEHIERRWYVIDAGGVVLGRVASEAAVLLRGKHKPIFAPHMDTGDHVVIVNADKVALTGGKEMKKIAYRHSGHPGGITATRYEDLLSTRPVFAVEKAVRGMLPKNRLGRAMIKKLHVVAGPDHPHAAQKPVALTLGERPIWEGLPAPKAASAPEPSAPEAAETPAEAAPKATRSGSSGAKPAAASKATAKKPVAKTKTTATKKPVAKTKTTAAKKAPERAPRKKKEEGA